MSENDNDLSQDEINDLLGGLAEKQYAEAPAKKVLPAGGYHLKVTSLEIKKTKVGGAGIRFGLVTTAGDQVSEWINLRHPTSPKAVEIGHETLQRMGACLGLTGNLDPRQFLDLTIGAIVEIEESPTHGKQNRIKKYCRTSEVSDSASAVVAAAEVAAPSNRWSKK